MNKPKRPSSIDIDHRSTKRRKPVHSTSIPVYSTRVVTWDEQRRLPEKFHKDGRGVWPALRIAEERGTGSRKQYLVEWEPHPTTKEIFAPSWIPAEDTGASLQEEWEQAHKDIEEDPRARLTSPVPTRAAERNLSRPKTAVRRNNHRIIPDSSEQLPDQVSGSRTPTLVGSSPASTDTSASPVEISETQPAIRTALSVNIPDPPADKTEYESIRGSQFSISNLEATQVSPIGVLARTPQGFRPSSSLGRNNGNSTDRSPELNSLHSNRSRRSASLRVSRPPQRILSYESQVEIPNSIPNSGRTSVTSAQAHSSGQQVVHESSPRTGRSNRSVQTVAPQISATLPRTPEGSAATRRNGLRISTSAASSQPSGFQNQSTFASQAQESESLSSSLRTTNGLIGNDTTPTSSQVAKLAGFSPYVSSSKPGMAARTTRQSPRLQATIPSVSSSPRVAVRTSNNRNRIVTMAPEVSSPLATAAPEFAVDDDATVSKMFSISPTNSRDFAMSFPEPLDNSGVPPTTIPPSDMHLDPTAHMGTLSTQNDVGDMSYGSISMPIQQSIEEEQMSSNEDMSLESKASSSQDSLKNERPVPQTDGLLMPTYPILGIDEYCIALPAEGKVQAIYHQTLKIKRKSVLKFIHRRGSVNTAGTSTTKTIERNNMLELIQRLHDITTHTDLGLPGIPTQYSIPSQEHAAYAEYAGSKFMFLGFLVDNLIRRDCTIAILSNPGPTHDLLEEYLQLKKVDVRRHTRTVSMSQQSQPMYALKVELLSTQASTLVDLAQKPSLVIAFDASFDSMNPQLKHMRTHFLGAIPVVHLMITNSSEHVERCLPASMPSPIRLKTLVRATYQAQENLGGTPTYVPDSATEELHAGRPINLAELNKTIRKSPQRKLAMVAAIVAATTLSDDFSENWTLNDMPSLTFEDLEEISPSSKESRAASVTPNTRRARSNTPLARIGGQANTTSQPALLRTNTPNTRKRLLDVDNAASEMKRQRMTPVHETQSASDSGDMKARVEELERELNAVRAELVIERNARSFSENARVAAERKQNEWRTSLASLQRRYEQRVKQSHQLQRSNEALLSSMENGKARIEKLSADGTALRNQLVSTKLELVTAREDLKAVGGDIAALEFARSDARTSVTQAKSLEKSLESIKRDFDFTRSQYQDVSNRAVEFASKISSLEAENHTLKRKASDEARKLKEMNFKASTGKYLSRIEQLELEKRTREVLLKKQDEEIKGMKRTRGVQTRGSSVQPPGSPGARSRQGSPVLGHLTAVGSRASALRNER